MSLWYKNHSTPNPLGVEPDPAFTRIVVGDKFGDDGVEVEDDPDALERRRKEVEQQEQENKKRCDYHQSYPGVCQCNKNMAHDSDQDVSD